LRWFWIKTRIRVWLWNNVKRHWYAWRYPDSDAASDVAAAAKEDIGALL